MSETKRNMPNQEEQFIIRFPPQLAKRIRKMLKGGQFSDNASPREGCLYIEDDGRKEEYKVFLADLPCVVETHKTLNCKDFYKSGDIGQIFLVQDATTTYNLDEENYVTDGLTPASKNIRKRKFRKRPQVPKDAILEAQKEILSLQKGGKAKDFEIEEIPVEEVDEIYLTPYGNTIVTLKNGKPPIRAGKPNTFTDAELELLPQQHKEAALKEEEQKEAEFAKHLEEELEHIDVEEESEEEPGKKRQKKDAPRGAKKDEDEDEDEDEEEEDEEMPQAPEANTQMFKPDDELPPEIEQQIRGWRIEKVDIANDISRLQKQKQGLNLQLKANMQPRLKQVLEGKMQQFNNMIEAKRQEMAKLDEKLAVYDRL